MKYAPDTMDQRRKLLTEQDAHRKYSDKDFATIVAGTWTVDEEDLTKLVLKTRKVGSPLGQAYYSGWEVRPVASVSRADIVRAMALIRLKRYGNHAQQLPSSQRRSDPNPRRNYRD